MSDIKMKVSIVESDFVRCFYCCNVTIAAGESEIKISDEFEDFTDAWMRSHEWRRLAKLFAAEFEFNVE
jgi:hypothetical protein